MQVAVGTRIELVRTDDPYTDLKPGDRGTVIGESSVPGGGIWVKWDNGSTLGLIWEAGDRWKEVEDV
jgi:hypothetical protein